MKYLNILTFSKKLFSLTLVITIARRVGHKISSTNQSNQINCYLLECKYKQQLQDWKGLCCDLLQMTVHTDT